MSDKREGVMLAKVYTNQRLGADWYMSEKLDGERCFWDGGISRGQLASAIPYAFKPKPSALATGLWTRNMKVIHAPDAWVASLPRAICLDGELYTGRQDFQGLSSIVRREDGFGQWNTVRYHVFDAPTLFEFLTPGRMRVRGIDFEIKRILPNGASVPWEPRRTFSESLKLLRNFSNEILVPVAQEQLPALQTACALRVQDALLHFVEQGAEGLMLRKDVIWCPRRSDDLLKVKTFNDSEAIVKGYTDGAGRHLGRMGALIVQWQRDNISFEIGGGFSDRDREQARDLYPIGTEITFRYLGLTDQGVPKHANFWRKGG